MLIECGHPERRPVPRFDTVSPFGLATLIAGLHLAILAGRMSARCPRGRHAALLVYREPSPSPVDVNQDAQHAPSNPMQAYSAGRLALTFGVAVLALAFQLQVMHMGAARGR